MEGVLHFIAIAFKLGLGLCIAICCVVFLAYAVESHCWRPTGCHRDTQESRDIAWSADHADTTYGK